jgi:hypothetical protein
MQEGGQQPGERRLERLLGVPWRARARDAVIDVFLASHEDDRLEQLQAEIAELSPAGRGLSGSGARVAAREPVVKVRASAPSPGKAPT